MTRISIPGPKHTFLLVAVQPEPSNFKKKFRPSVYRWSLSWHMSATGLTLVDVQWPVCSKVLGSIPGNSKLMACCIYFCICFCLHVCKWQ